MTETLRSHDSEGRLGGLNQLRAPFARSAQGLRRRRASIGLFEGPVDQIADNVLSAPAGIGGQPNVDAAGQLASPAGLIEPDLEALAGAQHANPGRFHCPM